jgi:hypothetical protein
MFRCKLTKKISTVRVESCRHLYRKTSLILSPTYFARLRAQIYDELRYWSAWVLVCKLITLISIRFIGLTTTHPLKTIEALNDLITMGKVCYWCFIHVCREKGQYYPMVTSSTWSTWWKTQQYSLRVISTH